MKTVYRKKVTKLPLHMFLLRTDATTVLNPSKKRVKTTNESLKFPIYDKQMT